MKMVLFTLLYISAFAQDYAIISNKHIAKLSPAQIKAVFLKKLDYIEGVHLVPINLTSYNPIRLKFEYEILKMKKQRLKSYWTRQHYLGNRPPVVMKSQQSALVFLQKVEGAIAYIEMEHINKNINILYQWSDGQEK